jgi:hypothetical protein
LQNKQFAIGTIDLHNRRKDKGRMCSVLEFAEVKDGKGFYTAAQGLITIMVPLSHFIIEEGSAIVVSCWRY